MIAGFQGDRRRGQRHDARARRLRHVGGRGRRGARARTCARSTPTSTASTPPTRNLVPNARKLDRISYDEMLEMASLGAKVLQIRSVRFAMRYGVPLHVRSSFNDSTGTWVVPEEEVMEELVVSGVTYNRNEAKIRVRGVKRSCRASRRACSRRSREDGIVVDMIIQNLSQDGTTDMTFTVPRGDYARSLELARKLGREIGAQAVDGDPEIAKVSIVGLGMKRPRGRRDEHVPGARRRRHQHPADLDQRDQGLGRDRGEVHRAGGARAARGVRRGRRRGAGSGATEAAAAKAEIRAGFCAGACAARVRSRPRSRLRRPAIALPPVRPSRGDRGERRAHPPRQLRRPGRPRAGARARARPVRAAASTRIARTRRRSRRCRASDRRAHRRSSPRARDGAFRRLADLGRVPRNRRGDLAPRWRRGSSSATTAERPSEAGALSGIAAPGAREAGSLEGAGTSRRSP